MVIQMKQKPTMKISQKTMDELKELKEHPRETMEDVVKRLICSYNENEGI